MKKKIGVLEKESEEKNNGLCKGCNLPYVSICCVCRGKNQWLVNQVLREMTENGLVLFIAM